MRWLQMDWDEGPYFQSQRGPLYAGGHRQAAGRWHAPTPVTALLKQVSTGPGARPPGYDGYCRDRGLEADRRPGRPVPHSPTRVTTSVVDVVRGTVTSSPTPRSRTSPSASRTGSRCSSWPTSSTTPTCPSPTSSGARTTSPTPRSTQLLWEALGYGPLPVFAHLPLLVNEKRQKLSKRRDKVAVGGLPGRGLPARGHAQLPGPAGLVARVATARSCRCRRADRASSASRTSRAPPAFFDEKQAAGDQRRACIRALHGRLRRARSQDWLRERWAPIAPLVQERARMLGDVSAWSTSSWSPTWSSTTEDWEKGVRQQPAFAGPAGGRDLQIRDLRLGRRDPQRRGGRGGGRRRRPAARQGPGADPSGHHRPLGRSSPVRVAGAARSGPDARAGWPGPPGPTLEAPER